MKPNPQSVECSSSAPKGALKKTLKPDFLWKKYLKLFFLGSVNKRQDETWCAWGQGQVGGHFD